MTLEIEYPDGDRQCLDAANFYSQYDKKSGAVEINRALRFQPEIDGITYKIFRCINIERNNTVAGVIFCGDVLNNNGEKAARFYLR